MISSRFLCVLIVSLVNILGGATGKNFNDSLILSNVFYVVYTELHSIGQQKLPKCVPDQTKAKILKGLLQTIRYFKLLNNISYLASILGNTCHTTCLWKL